MVLFSHLHSEVLKADVKQSVEILSDCLLDEVGVDAPGDYPYTYEGRQQGAGLELGGVGEGVETYQTHQVTQGLGQSEERK